MAEPQKLLDYAKLLVRGATDANIQVRAGLDEKRRIVQALSTGKMTVQLAASKLAALVDSEAKAGSRVLRWLDDVDSKAALRMLKDNLPAASEAGIGHQVSELLSLSQSQEQALRDLVVNINRQLAFLKEQHEMPGFLTGFTPLLEKERDLVNALAARDSEAASLWQRIRSACGSMAGSVGKAQGAVLASYELASQALSPGEKLGVGVVAAVVPLGILLSAAYVFYRTRNKQA